MMTSAQIRQSFLDFFKSKQHTIVPSSSLRPDSPNLLFTNAGMNQFVPIFLGERRPDVSQWAGAAPGLDTRAADTQKCIRAGGKHNDLDDVGLDTYHLTFFEMLGNWSFGDYFKKESLTWGWELLTQVWRIPAKRLFATVYAPDPSKGDPAEFDHEAYDIWAGLFRASGLDPAVHIVSGGKKDNFWMMGDTGPCGPCSEVHLNLMPSDDEPAARALINTDSQRCIEIWNHVFIQFNANPDGSYAPLPSKHVDTGMGFDRIAGFYAGTKGFQDFSGLPSAYDTDIFRALFDELERLSGTKYTATLPTGMRSADNSPAQIDHAAQEQIAIDVSFRVIADHIRTLSFAIADGIQPGNTDRNYVLRRILRRAVRYGRTLGFHEPFFYKLVDVLVETMGDAFPEIRAKRQHVKEVIRVEEEAFNKTLDEGIRLFEEIISLEKETQAFCTFARPLLQQLKANEEIQECLQNFPKGVCDSVAGDEWRTGKREETHRVIHDTAQAIQEKLPGRSFELWKRVATDQEIKMEIDAVSLAQVTHQILGPLDLESLDFIPNTLMPKISGIELGLDVIHSLRGKFRGKAAFLLYDTYGFPLDLTELMARERGLTVDKEGFEKLMEEQRARARAAQKKEVITVSQEMTGTAAIVRPTEFVGYERLSVQTRVQHVYEDKGRTIVILDDSPLYAEMGGQVGDTGLISTAQHTWHITNTLSRDKVFLHVLAETQMPQVGTEVEVRVDRDRRFATQRHHTVTHLFHWALHEVVSKDATQKGSYVGPDKLTFDFNSAPLTPQQVTDIEKLVNERILENASVSWTEVPYADVKSRQDVLQFFGDKYGDTVRVVQIGGHPQKLDGYSMELCGGTHTRATGEIGLFRVVAESAISAGVRRIEAVAGLEAYRKATDELHLIKSLASKVNSPVGELQKKVEALLAHQKELEKTLKALQQREASSLAANLKSQAATIKDIPAVIYNLGAADGDFLQSVADALKGIFKGVIVLGGVSNGAVALVAAVTPEFTARVQAGKIVQQIAPIVGGKGGGKPDNARGGGKDPSQLAEALAKAKSLLG